jgi:hypothetical protein
MHRCKNDSSKYYTGTEPQPSPKGFGYCAHAEKINTIKKGKDGICGLDLVDFYADNNNKIQSKIFKG